MAKNHKKDAAIESLATESQQTEIPMTESQILGLSHFL
jgi:hypothetical protein